MYAKRSAVGVAEQTNTHTTVCVNRQYNQKAFLLVSLEKMAKNIRQNANASNNKKYNKHA